jgi:hypothetical protein
MIIVSCFYICSEHTMIFFENHLISIRNYCLDVAVTSPKVTVSGFCERGWRRRFRNFVKKFSSFEFCVESNNVGKSTIVNKILSTVDKEELIVVIDGDIELHFKSSPIVFQKIFQTLSVKTCNENCVLLFKMDGRNVLSSLVWKEANKIHTDPSVFRVTDENLIGGGCMMGFAKTFQRYPFKNVGKFGPEDYIFFKDVLNDKGGIFVIKDECVFHPENKIDIAYNAEKRQILFLFYKK